MAIKYEILDAESNMQFTSIYQALNDCFGTEYTGWMKATWPGYREGRKFRAWFPKLAEKKNGELTAAAFDCVNTISDDWNEVVFDDLQNRYSDTSNAYKGYDLIFAKEPKGGPYIFRGVYKFDEEKSRPNHYVSKRIGTKVRVIGSPATDIEILDNCSGMNHQNGINTPMQPKLIRVVNGIQYVTCGCCGQKFMQAPRCPECGQLIEY